MSEINAANTEGRGPIGSNDQRVGPNVLLGVSGGIAAYKTADLASKLVADGAVVRVIMTDNATQFVGPVTFEALTGRGVLTSMWDRQQVEAIQHISLVDWAHILVVAPATANIIAKAANGICDDLLSTTLCAGWKKPCLLAPAMNERMWSNPAVQRNIEAIKDMGFALVGPVSGRLACGGQGLGRMAEPPGIIAAIKKLIGNFGQA